MNEKYKKISESLKKFYSDAENRKRHSETLKKVWASGNRKPSPPEAYIRAAKTMRDGYASGRISVYQHSEETRKLIAEKLSKKFKGRRLRKSPMSQLEIDALKKRKMSDPRTAPGIENIKCRVWRLRSPDNVVYEFKNLRIFIEEHRNLFNPEDIVWKEGKNKNRKQIHMRCRALSGIEGLSPRKNNPAGSWNGWTWHSQTERIHNNGKDLLDRDTITASQAAATCNNPAASGASEPSQGTSSHSQCSATTSPPS